MKYRIIEKEALWTRSGTVFVPQEKYKFWPFWLNLNHGYSFATLKEAEAYIERHKRHVNFKTVIHEFDEKEKK